MAVGGREGAVPLIELFRLGEKLFFLVSSFSCVFPWKKEKNSQGNSAFASTETPHAVS